MSNNTIDNNMIIRYDGAIMQAYCDNEGTIKFMKNEDGETFSDGNQNTDADSSSMMQALSLVKHRKVYTRHNNNNAKSYVTKKKKVANTIKCDLNNSQVIFINGNWNRARTNYAANNNNNRRIRSNGNRMHNVNVDELHQQQQQHHQQQSLLHGGLGNKQMKFDAGDYVPSPLSSDSGIEGDSDGNLSWLLNYKIEELPPVPDCNTYDQGTYNYCQDTQIATYRQDKHYYEPNNTQYVQEINVAPLLTEKDVAVRSSNAIDDNRAPNHHHYKYKGSKKPPFTYTELIEHALNEKGELTVSGIYQWISDHFPFYKQNDDRWKNSVRHNLSINPHFRKGGKALHGAGHLWTIAQKDDKKSWNIKKQRMQQFMETTYNDWHKEKPTELDLATASILPENAADDYQGNCVNSNEIYIQHPNALAIKEENVHIEYVIDMEDQIEEFLCPPVSKQQVVEECGLTGDYLITDLNPTTLGLNLGEAEIITDGNIYDDLNFQCYELQSEQ